MGAAVDIFTLTAKRQLSLMMKIHLQYVAQVKGQG